MAGVLLFQRRSVMTSFVLHTLPVHKVASTWCRAQLECTGMHDLKSPNHRTFGECPGLICRKDPCLQARDLA